MDAQLTEMGMYVGRVHNGAKAREDETYANADAEKWFTFRRLLEKRGVILPVDGELLKQLSSRRMQYDARGRIQLESKESLRARGLESLDRADAIIGAMLMAGGGYGCDGITERELAGICFGRPGGGRALFDSQWVSFDEESFWRSRGRSH